MFNRILVKVLLALAVLMLMIQVVPYGRNHSNPPARTEPDGIALKPENSLDVRASTAIATRPCGRDTPRSRRCHGSYSTTWMKAEKS